MRLAQIFAILFAATSCTDGGFSGLSGAIKGDGHKAEPEKEVDDAEAPKPRVDEPVWINGATLTCDWKSIESESTAGLSCGLKGRDGAELAPPEHPLPKNWSITDADGASVGFERSISETAEFDIALAMEGREIPGSTITVWVVLGNTVFDYSAKFNDVLEKLAEPSPLATCLRDGLDLHKCFRDAGIDLSGGFTTAEGLPAPTFLLCPRNYVSVPLGATAGTISPFCAAKYEMKRSQNGTATSESRASPMIVATKVEAADACSGIGPGYALITNSEWMIISSNIAANSVNWRDHVIDPASQLAGGHHEDLPPSLLGASRNDSEGCFGLDAICDPGSWAGQKRTFILSNDSIIWDFSGNAWEVVDFSPKVSSADPTVFDIAGRWKNYDRLGPIGGLSKSDLVVDLPALTSTDHVGQFYISDTFADADVFTVVRGGSRSDSPYTGINAFALLSDQELPVVTRNELGFRCVFHPEAVPVGAPAPL
jgi:hypothetical protein